MDDVNKLSYYLFANDKYYEPMDYCVVKESDYLDLIKSRLDTDWKIIRSGIWLNCLCLKQAMPLQGWKIHLSATYADSGKILHSAWSAPLKLNRFEG